MNSVEMGKQVVNQFCKPTKVGIDGVNSKNGSGFWVLGSGFLVLLCGAMTVSSDLDVTGNLTFYLCP